MRLLASLTVILGVVSLTAPLYVGLAPEPAP